MKFSVPRFLPSLVVCSVALLLSANLFAQGNAFSHDSARRLAKRLGMGSRMAATLMLNGGFPDSWVDAVGKAGQPGYLQWPLPGKRLGRGFGSDDGRHLAVDSSAPIGTPVHVMAPGVVGYADDGVKGYGNLVMVVHGGGWVTLYAHLDKFKVEPGQRVHRGDVIALSGNTGISRGPHLHFALIVRGVPKDPMKYMMGVPPRTQRLARLLP